MEARGSELSLFWSLGHAAVFFSIPRTNFTTKYAVKSMKMALEEEGGMREKGKEEEKPSILLKS